MMDMRLVETLFVRFTITMPVEADHGRITAMDGYDAAGIVTIQRDDLSVTVHEVQPAGPDGGMSEVMRDVNLTAGSFVPITEDEAFALVVANAEQRRAVLVRSRELFRSLSVA